MAAMLVAVAVAVVAVGPAQADTAPDPGGQSTGFQAVSTLSGKLFGFNTFLGAWQSGSGVSPAQEAQLIANTGGSLQRFALNWSGLQPTAGGPISFPRWADTAYLALTSHQPAMRPVITIGDAPIWASRYPVCWFLDLRCWLARSQTQKPPATWSVNAYAQLVAAIARRYPLAVIETWNEPNESAFWRDAYPATVASLNPGLMAQMQCAAYDAVKALGNPQRIVLAPGVGAGLSGTTTSMAYAPYMAALYQGMGGRICWDHVNVHLYNDGNYAGANTVFAQQMQAIRQSRAAAGDSTSIWVTETGLSTTGCSLGAGCATQAQQTAWQVNGVYKLLTMPDVQAVLVHTLRDAPSPADTVLTSFGYGFGMLYVGAGPTPWPKSAYCFYTRAESHPYPGC